MPSQQKPQRKQAPTGIRPTTKTQGRLPLIIARDVKTRKINWLWYPYIPDGNASLLFGPGKMGKSHITVDIAARLSRGDALPGESDKVRRAPVKVLMLSAEDEYETVLVPRLIEAGANLNLVGFPPEPFTLDEQGLKRLERYIKEFGPSLVTIDPIVHYMGGKVDMFRSNEVRQVIGGLHQLAIRTHTAILIVGHTRKGGEGEDYEKAMGSVDFINAVRSVLMVARTPDGYRVLRHVSTNYAKEGDSIPFEFGDNGFVWGEPFPEGSDTVKKPPEPQKLGKQAQSAVDFLKNLLSGGPLSAKEVEGRAIDMGINARTLARAKVGVAESYAERECGRMKWFWKLIGDQNEPERPEVHHVEDTGGAEDAPPDQGGPTGGGVQQQEDGGTGATGPQVGDGGHVSEGGGGLTLGSDFAAEIERLLAGGAR